MRPFRVVLLEKDVEARLLLQEIRRRRLGRLLFEREVHAFMPPVLFRVAPPDALYADL